MFLSSYRNTCESLREAGNWAEILALRARVPAQFFVFCKLPLVFLYLYRKTENVFDSLNTVYCIDYAAAVESLTRFDPAMNLIRQITQGYGNFNIQWSAYTKHPIIAFAAKHYAKKWM